MCYLFVLQCAFRGLSKPYIFRIGNLTKGVRALAIKYPSEKLDNHKIKALKHGYMPDWQLKIGRKRNLRYITDLKQIPQLNDEERERLERVSAVFGFRTNSYYLSLIDWNDPDDPIRKIVIPDPVELEDIDSELDASHEATVTVAPGCEHKYEATALILISRICGGMCRFCFRKRIFMPHNEEISPNTDQAVDYIENHREINNVLLTGGDAFMLSTGKIKKALQRLRHIPHIRSIRFGTKLLAFNPYRFIDDPELLDILEENSHQNARIYITTHFNHINEISNVTLKAIDMLLRRGLLLITQSPFLAGINDDPDTLSDLFNRLQEIGAPPYYIFQCRPTRGNAHFKVPMKRGIDIFERAKRKVSGIAKRLRYVGSHASGKIEMLGYDDSFIYFRYHESKVLDYTGQFFKLPRKDDATWWDDWMPNGESFTLDTCPDVELGSGTM
jgi:KamA family protein